MLEIERLSAGYGDVTVLREISLTIGEGQIVALIGANGAGKTTTLRAISGLIRPRGGAIRFQQRPVHRLSPHRIVAEGLVQVPEGRHLFRDMSVLENLLLGAVRRGRRDRARRLERVLDLFPRLAERRHQFAGTLSGGEQQMLAIGRAYMTDPVLLMLDEPSLGLAPLIVRDIFRIIREIREAGTTILVVEQNAVQTLGMADYAYVLENGQIALSGPGQELLDNPRIQSAYLGL